MARAMTKSAVRVAQAAYRMGQELLPRYGRPRAPRRYTQPQLYALLIVRAYLDLDYRGLTTLVREWGELRRVLGLHEVPHYSTLCYAEHRLLGEKRGTRTLTRPRPSPDSSRPFA